MQLIYFGLWGLVAWVYLQVRGHHGFYYRHPGRHIFGLFVLRLADVRIVQRNDCSDLVWRLDILNVGVWVLCRIEMMSFPLGVLVTAGVDVEGLYLHGLLRHFLLLVDVRQVHQVLVQTSV